MQDLLKSYQNRLSLFKKHGYDIPRARNFILDKTDIFSGSILELGTGKGHMAIALAKRALKFTSIDVDKSSQKMAKSIIKTMKLGKLGTFRIMDAQKLKYKDGAFDYVIAVNFMHHSKNPMKCLKEMIRITKEKLVIADLNKRGSYAVDKIHKLGGHKHEKTKISMYEVRKILQKCNMDVKTYRDTCQVVLVAEKG